MTDPADLVHEAAFAVVKGDSAAAAKLTDAAGRLGWFLGRIPAGFGLSDEVAAVTVDAETARIRGAHAEVTLTLTVSAQKHGLAKSVAADLARLLDPSPGKGWRPLALQDGAKGSIRMEFAAWDNDPLSELSRRTLRFRALVARPRAA